MTNKSKQLLCINKEKNILNNSIRNKHISNFLLKYTYVHQQKRLILNFNSSNNIFHFKK